MAYIGVSPSNGVRQKHTYTATASQTSFSGAGAEGISLSYLDSNYVDVYQNGVKLGDADYTANNGTSIVLDTTASDADIVEIIVYDVFSVADTVSKADGGTFDGNVTMAGTITVTGNADLNGDLDVDGTTNLDAVDIDGAVDMASTLGVTGVVTANAGVVVDNITIDGQEIDVSSGDLTLDVAGDINLDTDAGEINLKDGGTLFGLIFNSSTDLVIQSATQDKDLIFKGNDGGAVISALTLDMSAGGNATFNNSIAVADGDASAPGFRFKDDLNNGMFRAGTDIIGLSTAGTERLRLDSSGRVLMGTTSTVFDTDQVLHISGTQGCNIRATVSSVGGSVLNLQRSDTTEGDFLRIINSSDAETGQIKVNSSGTTVFENVSDYRLKDNIKDWTVDAIAKVKQIKIRTFDWKDQTAQTNGKDVIGVIAHELQEVYPYCVSGEKDGYGEDIDKDGNKKPMYQGVDYGKLTPLLTKALQEQQATIEALTARITTLENA